MYNGYYNYSSPSYSSSSVSASGVWLIIATVLAVIGGIVLYYTFLSKKNENKFTGFLATLYDFLTFKKMLLEALLKIIYLIVAIFITLAPFSFINSNFLGALVTIIFGNVVARLGYEFMLLLLVICRNTTEINKKLGGTVTKKED